MSLDQKVKDSLKRALTVVDDHGTIGPRLLDDAIRLWNRVGALLALNLVDHAGLQPEALELACYAVQLPLRQTKTPLTGKLGRTNLRDRAEQGAEMIIGLLEEKVDDKLLDAAARILHELPKKSPVLDEAKVLADAINLDDFSLTGIFSQAVQLGLLGQGVAQVVEGLEKRDAYGYWGARLKDGFHFEPVRQLARKRLDRIRQLALSLKAELEEDRGK